MNQITETQDSGYSRIIKQIEDLKADYLKQAKDLRSYIVIEAQRGNSNSGLTISDFGTKVQAFDEKIQLISLIKWIIEDEARKEKKETV